MASSIRAAVVDRRRSGLYAALALILIFGVDSVDPLGTRPLLAAALLDESAHLATALLFLRALDMQVTRSSVLGLLLGAVMIDIDHVPLQLFGNDILTAGTNRPHSHSLLALALVLLIGFALSGMWRRGAFCLALGHASHLARDMATGGVPLLWPLSSARIEVAYSGYALMVIVAALLTTWPRTVTGTDSDASRTSAALQDTGDRNKA
jgi:inner membrane protein